MISAEEGYKRILKEHVMDRLDKCLDFGDFYVYFFKPANEPDETYFTGTQFDAINKRSGECFIYDILSNYEAFENAKQVDIKDVYDIKLKIN